MTEKYDPELTGLVITDPQNDFLNPKGVFWDAVKASVTENNTCRSSRRGESSRAALCKIHVNFAASIDFFSTNTSRPRR